MELEVLNVKIRRFTTEWFFWHGGLSGKTFVELDYNKNSSQNRFVYNYHISIVHILNKLVNIKIVLHAHAAVFVKDILKQSITEAIFYNIFIFQYSFIPSFINTSIWCLYTWYMHTINMCFQLV